MTNHDFEAAACSPARPSTARHAAHAACAHSRVRRARPDVERTSCHTHTAGAGSAKRDFPAKSAKCATRRPSQPAWRATPRPATLPALAPGYGRHGPMQYSRSLCSYGAHRLRKFAGGAGRLGGVGRGDFLSSVFLSLAERTWCGRARSFLSELHPSLFRQITALRRRGSAMSAQSACRRRAPALACAIPHLQRRGAPFRRELEEQMRIAALLESSRHSNVEDRLRPVALQAGEWECRCVRGRTSRWSRGGLGGAPRVQRSLPWTSRVRRSDWHTCIPLRRWPEAAHPRATLACIHGSQRDLRSQKAARVARGHRSRRGS